MALARDISLDKMVRAVEKVRGRLLNSVAAWVSSMDEAAVRNTRDVDVLVRRSDFEAIRRAFETAGFVYRHTAGLDVVLDGPEASVRDSVHLIFANEMVREHEAMPNPGIESASRAEQ